MNIQKQNRHGHPLQAYVSSIFSLCLYNSLHLCSLQAYTHVFVYACVCVCACVRGEDGGSTINTISCCLLVEVDFSVKTFWEKKSFNANGGHFLLKLCLCLRFIFFLEKKKKLRRKGLERVSVLFL